MSDRSRSDDSSQKPLTVALVPGGDRFEDFFDKIGVSLETFRDEFTGGWLFNYIRALRLAEVRTVLVYASARVAEPVHLTHADTGADVWVLPSPALHKKARHAQRRFLLQSAAAAATASYLSTPVWTVAQVLRRERCDAILCQEYEQTRFDVCVALGRILGLPVFATYQGANDTRTPFERVVRRLGLRWCSGLIVPSASEIARVQHVYHVPLQKIARIPNPVETVPVQTLDRETARAELGIGRETRVVAWHGRVQIDTKGLDVLLDAWDRICSQRPEADIRLLLVGSGRDADALRERLRSTARVVWVDRYIYSRRHLWSYLSAADLYAIPSRREGFAVAVLEAMACGLAAVASQAPGVSDVLPHGEADGGVLVPPENPAALASALLDLIDHPQRAARLGEIARQRMTNEFALEVIGPQLRRFLFPARS